MHSVSVWAMAPLIRAEMDLTAAQFGLFVSAYYGAQTVSAFPAGAFVDRVGVGRSLIVSMFILALGALSLSVATGLWSSLGSMAIMGLGYALVNPASARGVLNWFAYERRATAMGVKQTGVPVGGVLAAGCGILATVIDWRMVLWIVAGLTIVNVLCVLPLLRIPRKPRPPGPFLPVADILAVVRDGNLRVFGAINTLLQVGQSNFFAFLTLFLRDVGQTSQRYSSVCLGLAQITSAIGRVGWGVVCDRMFRGRRARLVLSIAIVAAAGLAAMVLINPGNVAVTAVALSAILGLTIASTAGLTLTIASETAEPEKAGTAVGFNLMMVCLGGVIGPPLFGLVMDATSSYATGWLLTAALVAVAAVLLAFVFRERIAQRH